MHRRHVDHVGQHHQLQSASMLILDQLDDPTTDNGAIWDLSDMNTLFAGGRRGQWRSNRAQQRSSSYGHQREQRRHHSRGCYMPTLGSSQFPERGGRTTRRSP